VNRLKLMKRSMYGRAEFDLLKLRVLHRSKKSQDRKSKKKNHQGQQVGRLKKPKMMKSGRNSQHTTGDINVMVERATSFDVVLAPSSDGTGTNTMLAHPPLAVPYLFGVNCLRRHLRAANQRGLSSNLYLSRGLSLDIDTIEDVQELERICQGDRKGAPLPYYESARATRTG